MGHEEGGAEGGVGCVWSVEFLELMWYQAITSNTKLYFGPNIPNFFLRDDGTSPQTSNTPPLADKLGTYCHCPLRTKRLAVVS